MKKFLLILLSLAFVLSCASCTGANSNNGVTMVTTEASVPTEVSKPSDNFTLSKWSDGGYAVTGFESDVADPHEVIIPANYEGTAITAIAPGAFKESSAISKIIIPDSITYIGYGAFNDCDNLASVTFGKRVTSIGSYAFKS